MIGSTKKIGLIIGAIGLPAMTLGLVYVGTNGIIRPTKATSPTILSSTNSPELSNGAGTIVDDKGVTWKYYHASDYASGHVSIGHKGYFGISQHSAYGYTGISDITVNFSADGNNELWLLVSKDGINWGEQSTLTNGEAFSLPQPWRYIRFYNWDADNLTQESATSNELVYIDSVQIAYSCSGISSVEDVDGAKAANVIATTGLSYEDDFSNISPNSVDGSAVTFTKTGEGNTDITIGFGKTYKIENIQNAKVEFDMKTSRINYGKSIGLYKNSTSVGSTMWSNKTNAYKCTNIQDDWYHIEIPITTFISTISGIWVNGVAKDQPHTDVGNKEVNAIKINAGDCTIDNLRITSTPCELGNFNNPDYKPSVNEFFWLKTAWVGKLYPELVSITFSDNALAKRIPIDDKNLMNGSPFYVQLLGTGTVTMTCTVISGYNRQPHTIVHDVVVK